MNRHSSLFLLPLVILGLAPKPAHSQTAEALPPLHAEIEFSKSAGKTGMEKSLADKITRACEDRQTRMLAMNEAMLKLREAGSEEDAARIERRLLAMVETKDPREDDALMANKAEIDALKTQISEMTQEIAKLASILSQNSRIIDEILSKAVPDVSPAVLDELKTQAAKKSEVRKAP